MGTKTITLTDLAVTKMIIDYENQCVIVDYKIVDANNQEWVKGTGTFWVEIPQQIPPLRADWFQLPEEYIPLLLSLRDDADEALTSVYLP